MEREKTRVGWYSGKHEYQQYHQKNKNEFKYTHNT